MKLTLPPNISIRVLLLVGVVLFICPSLAYSLVIACNQQQQVPSENEIKTAANKAFREGLSLERGTSAESLQQAIKKYEEALLLFRSISDQRGELLVLGRAGSAYSVVGEHQKALDCFNSVLSIERSLRNRKGEVAALNSIGNVYVSMREQQKALDLFNQTLSFAREMGDRRGEARALTGIGNAYSSLGDYHKALDYYDQALTPLGELETSLREVEIRALAARQAAALGKIGGAYRLQGEQGKALEYYNRALSAARSAGDRRVEATALGSIGSVYSSLGENERAFEYFNQALALQREIADRSGEANTLYNTGLVYHRMGERQKALDYFNQALSLVRAVGDRGGETKALYGIGIVYGSLGESQKALAYFNQVLTLARSLGDRQGEANTLGNIGTAYYSLHDRRKALDYFTQALQLKRAVGDHASQANTLNNIAQVFLSLGDKQKALEHFNQALSLQGPNGDPREEARTLTGIGTVYVSLGEKGKSLDYYMQALWLQRSVGHRSGEAQTCANLMLLWSDLNNPAVAVLYGKQAINLYQQLRGYVQGLEMEIQDSYLRSIEPRYRKLADLLISEGRLPEAQAVLDLLKEKEFSQLARRSGANSGNLPYSAAEAAAVKLIDQLADIGRHRGELLEKQDKLRQSNQDLQASETQLLNQLDQQINEANKELRRSLDAFASTDSNARNRVDEVKKEQNLMRDLRELGAGTVALYTVLVAEVSEQDGNQTPSKTKGTGWIILVTPDFRKAYPIDVTNLEQTVFAFREVLRSDKYDPRPLAQQLYRMLFLQTSTQQKTTLAADLEAYLAHTEQQTLMWSLDGVLRYVPMAALHDGQRYLVERYRNVVFNTASLGSLKDISIKPWTALALGVTEAREEQGQTFSALTGAERELYAIVRAAGTNANAGVLPGVIRINKDFNKQTLTEGLRAGYPVVHIASHFSFNAAAPEQSFLLLGRDHLSVDELQDLSNPFEKVDLLTLSACDTAMGSGNGKEVEGFAYTAQSLGAKSVIASLWPVSDEGTQALMINFYRLRRDNVRLAKGEALRQAQLRLLKGDRNDVIAPTVEQRSSVRLEASSSATGTTPFQPDPIAKYSHPYYWAPFILIGNWK